jgi:hypothetical protein
MTAFSKLEKNFGLSSEENLELNSTSRGAVIAVETRDHLSNGVSPKDQRSRKNFLILACFALLVVFSGCQKEPGGNGNNNNNNNFSLDKNVDGKDLTEEYCIKLVRNYWDCNKGAWNEYWINNHCTYQIFDCKQGDEGKILACIQDLFVRGIDVEKSYYRNYILYLAYIDNKLLVNLTVTF